MSETLGREELARVVHHTGGALAADSEGGTHARVGAAFATAGLPAAMAPRGAWAVDGAGAAGGDRYTMTDDTLDRVFAADDYLHFYGPGLAERNAQDVALVEQLLGLPAGEAILDLGCGHGRITNGLAERGFAVTGLDRSEAFVRLAMADAATRGVSPCYVLGDFRALPADWSGRFAAVVSWFHSFGYFSEEANAETLRQVARVLRPGGVFLVDMPNILLHLHRSLHPLYVTVCGDDFMLDRWSYDPVTGRVEVVRRLVRADRPPRQVVFTARLYTCPELCALLASTGFSDIQASDPAGKQFQVDSHRLVVRARVVA